MRRAITTDGLTLTVETLGSGPPLVFAHGLTGTRRGVLRQLAPLADRFQIIVYDQRGHGDSRPVTDPARYDADRMAADLAAVLDALDIPRAIVGGESMGAATTLLFALRWPERVEKLLLTAPAFGETPNTESPRLKEMAAGIAGLGMPGFLARAAERQRDLLGWSPEAVAHVAESFSAHDPASLAVALQTVSDWQPFPDLSVLADLACPTCIIAWDGDPLHPLALARQVAATLPHAELHLIPTLPAVFVQPTLVGEVYRRFLLPEG
ncbi:MAG: alpha/beta hydrolase [Anaerolineae bacterium]|nr:alpha/beta hydrolase [Anaerolineae bacterium]